MFQGRFSLKIRPGGFEPVRIIFRDIGPDTKKPDFPYTREVWLYIIYL
jgi:hypothetical protein